MPLGRTQNAKRAVNYRVRVRADGLETDLPPTPPNAGDAGPDQDARTGRFVKGNAASRRRKAKALARVVGIAPEKVAPWLRPFVADGTAYATDLIASLPVQAPELNALAMDTAAAAMVVRALFALGAAGDMKALAEARAWLKEHRQSVIALRGLTAETPRPETDVHADLATVLAAEARKP